MGSRARAGAGICRAGLDLQKPPAAAAADHRSLLQWIFLSSDPWSEHSPGSPSICTASYSTFCSLPKRRRNNQHREMVSQPEPFFHPNSCLCKLSAIPDCHHSLLPTEVLHTSGRKILPYLPTFSCSTLPRHVRAGRQKPSPASSALLCSCHSARSQPLPEKL